MHENDVNRGASSSGRPILRGYNNDYRNRSTSRERQRGQFRNNRYVRCNQFQNQKVVSFEETEPEDIDSYDFKRLQIRDSDNDDELMRITRA